MENGWITGWKRIARYIGTSIRTAKRYHYEYSMPVRRLPGSRPVAFEYELDLWLVKFDELMKEYTTKEK